MVSLERYDVKRDGTIIDKKTNKPVKIFKSNKYLQCCIYDENGKHVMGVHNVIAQVYCKDWFEGCVVHHKDNNQHNNDPDNLECLTNSDHTRQHNPHKYKDEYKICPCCKKEFLWKAKAQSEFYRHKYENGPFCSKRCCSKYTYKFTSNMGKSKFNHLKPEECWNSKQVMCIETGIIYPSSGEASRQLNIGSSFIRMVANAQRRSAHGLHFKYV